MASDSFNFFVYKLDFCANMHHEKNDSLKPQDVRKMVIMQDL